MMLVTIKQYTIECDVCRLRYEHTFPDIDQMINSAKETGWYCKTQHLCPECLYALEKVDISTPEW